MPKDMDQLDNELCRLLEELESADGLTSPADSKALATIADIESVVTEILPHSLTHRHKRHDLRLCLRRLSRCLERIEETMLTLLEDSPDASIESFVSERLARNMITLVTRLRIPSDDESAFELAVAILHSCADVMAEANVLITDSQDIQVIHDLILQHGTVENHETGFPKAGGQSLCLSWLKLVIRQSILSEESWQSVNSNKLTKDGSNPSSDPRLAALRLDAALHNSNHLIQNAQSKIADGGTVQFNEIDIHWHHFTVVLLRQIIYLWQSDSQEQPLRDWLLVLLKQSSFPDEEQERKLAGVKLFQNLQTYIGNLVEVTLDIVDSSSSSLLHDSSVSSKESANADKKFSSTLQTLDTAGDSRSQQFAASGSAVKLATITTRTIFIAQSNGGLSGLVDSKLPIKLWKCLATSFVETALEANFQPMMEALCDCILMIASVALKEPSDKSLGSTLTMTFLRALEFPRLLVEAKPLWKAIKHHIVVFDNLDMKHAIQAAALTLQKSTYMIANRSNENMRTSEMDADLHALKQEICVQIMGILQGIQRDSSTKKAVTKVNCASEIDPWDEIFNQSMAQLGWNDGRRN